MLVKQLKENRDLEVNPQQVNHNEMEIFAISDRELNKLSDDTQFVKIKVILLEIQLLESQYIFLYFVLSQIVYETC